MEVGRRIEGAGQCKTCGLPQVTSLLRPMGLPITALCGVSIPQVPRGDSSGEGDGGAGKEGSTHITEKWMPVGNSVAAISQNPFSPKTLGK